MSDDYKIEFQKIYPKYIENFDALDRLAKFVEHKSKFINITSIRDYESIWAKHIIDSLVVTELEEIQRYEGQKRKILDVGTGGGFPGLPIALTHPEWSLFLLDSTQKKLKVVEEFISSENLLNAQTVLGRAEVLNSLKSFEGEFDVVLARGIAELEKVINLCMPFVKPGGYLALYKSVTEPSISHYESIAKNSNLIPLEKYSYEIMGDKRVLLLLKRIS